MSEKMEMRSCNVCPYQTCHHLTSGLPPQTYLSINTLSKFLKHFFHARVMIKTIILSGSWNHILNLTCVDNAHVGFCFPNWWAYANILIIMLLNIYAQFCNKNLIWRMVLDHENWSTGSHTVSQHRTTTYMIIGLHQSHMAHRIWSITVWYYSASHVPRLFSSMTRLTQLNSSGSPI